MKRTKGQQLFKRKLTALTASVLLGLYGTSVTGAAEAAPVIVSGGGRDVFEVRYLTITDKNKEAAGFVRGSHDKDWSCSVTVKRMW